MKYKLIAFVFVFLLALQLGSAALSDGIYAYYKMDDTSGNARDSGPFGRNATSTTVGYSFPGKINTAFNFSGSSDGMASPFNANNVGNNFTIFWWFNSTTNSVQQYLVGSTTGAFAFSVSPRSTGVFLAHGTADTNTGYIPTLNVWNFFAVTFNGTTYTTYVNGAKNFTIAGSNPNDAVWTWGRHASLTGYQFRGRMDETGVYNRTLTDAEILELYTVTNGGSSYPFNVPTVSLLSPPNGTSANSTQILRANITSANLNNTNQTLYIWYTNSSVFTTVFNASTSNSTIQQNWTISNITHDVTYRWNVLAGLSNGSSIWSLSNFTFTGNYITSRLNFTQQVFETQTYNVTFNVTADFINNITANISVNGTVNNLTLTFLNSTFASFRAELQARNVDTTSTVLHWVNYTINGLTLGSTVIPQTIYPIANLTVGTCSTPSYSFRLIDEANFTNLNGTISYNFKYGLTNNTEISTYGTFTNTNFFAICTNLSTISQWELGFGEIFYTAPGYVERRYYLWEGLPLNVSNVNISLHSLATVDQTSFQLVVEDTSLNVYESKYTALIRWYPGLNEYRTVDMGLTDETGSTVIHVKSEDVDYRIGVFEQDGELIYLASPIRMTCLSSPCTYTLQITDDLVDYTNILGIENDLTYNYTTGLWTFTWTDPSLRTSSMNLTIWKDTKLTSYPVCTSTVSGTTGAVNCNSSAYSGTLRATVVRSASPGIIINQKEISTLVSEFQSSFGLWVSMLIALPIVFALSVISPVAGVVGGIISLLPALYFGSINSAIFGGIAVVGGVIVHFLGRVR